MQNGVAVPVDWIQIVFNPSFPYRLAHMATAAYLTTSFVVLAVGARYMIAGTYLEEAKTMLRMGVGFAAIVAPLQLFIGDQHGLNTLQHQPIKVAAMEANWNEKGSAPLILFAWPDQKNQKNRFEISIPGGASLILRHDANAAIPQLSSVPPAEQPPVANVFFAFRIMVGIGLFMIGAAFLGTFLWWRKTLFQTRWYLWPAQHVWWIGFVAVIAGWFVTEQGRQPWVIYGIMRTADAISPVPGGSVALTLAMFIGVYGIVFSMGIYYINRLIANGPKIPGDAPAPSGVPNRPFSSAHNEKGVRL